MVIAAGQPRWHVTGRQSAVVLGELVLSQRAEAAELLESQEAEMIRGSGPSSRETRRKHKSRSSEDASPVVRKASFLDRSSSWIRWNHVKHPDPQDPSLCSSPLEQTSRTPELCSDHQTLEISPGNAAVSCSFASCIYSHIIYNVSQFSSLSIPGCFSLPL